MLIGIVILSFFMCLLVLVYESVIVDPVEISDVDDTTQSGNGTETESITLVELIEEDTAPSPPVSQPKSEVVTYRRYGRADRGHAKQPLFKCHMCGFSCIYKQSLLDHFKEEHP